MTTQQDSAPTIAENIWITSKSRMNSEKRNRLYGTAAHVLLHYFATLLVVHSIIHPQADSLEQYEQANTILSIAVLVASLVVHGFKFGEKAQLHRDCYLRLQKLTSEESRKKQLVVGYNEILAGYPNHHDRDYEDLIISRHREGRPIYDSTGKVTPSTRMMRWRLAQKIFFWVSMFALVVAPPTLLFA